MKAITYCEYGLANLKLKDGFTANRGLFASALASLPRMWVRERS
jgi:hypothetical protein